MTHKGFISAFPAAWVAKFAHLGVIPGRSHLPPMDGDIALLHELRDRIFDAQPTRLQHIPAGFLYRQVVDKTWIDPRYIRWDDPAAELLAAWRSGR